MIFLNVYFKHLFLKMKICFDFNYLGKMRDKENKKMII
jgi:hypothetical protein